MQSIGERLEEARKRKGISIREAAEATKIRGEYLHKYEGNQFDIKLPEIYVRGFLRTYANYLKLPADKIINDYNALGLNDSKSGRGLNREVYGRMDLSVATAKSDKDSKDPAAPTGEPSESNETITRNPATFVPRPATPLRLDRNMLLKGGILAVIGIIAIVIVVWLISERSDKTKTAQASTSTGAGETVWLRPSPGDQTLTLVGVAAVQASVTQQDTGTVLFRGLIPKGEIRAIPWRGKLKIETDTPERLHCKVGSSEWELRDPKTNELLRSAEFAAPPSAR